MGNSRSQMVDSPTEALEGYRHDLTLEPDTKTVQRHLSECQKKRQKVEEQMSNKMARQEDEDVEVVYTDSERDPQTRYKNCTKNPGHKNFIKVKDFKMEDLPPAYRDPELFAHVKHQSQITVMLKVWPAGRSRPGCGPGTGRNKSGTAGPGRRVRPLRHGSGYLSNVKLHTEDEQPCPCPICKNSGSPERKWTEIDIMTAAHVVCDNEEANDTECHFFYDTEEVDVSSCPKLSSAIIDHRDEEYDTCGLKFISHDDNFSQDLTEMLMCFIQSVCSIRRKYHSSAFIEPKGSFLEQFEQLWQRCNELVTEFGHLVEQLVVVLNGDPRTELAKHRKGRKDKIEDDELGLMLWDKKEDGVMYQEMTESLQSEHEKYCKMLEVLTNQVRLLKQQRNNERDFTMKGVNFWQASVTFIERSVMWKRHWLDVNVPRPPPEELSEDHRLTVIVSHPHGCSKKITIGKTTERTTEQFGGFSEFTYTTPTCPGSSGALVFVLGLDRIVLQHPHSAKKSGRSLEQLNESAVALGM